jgi:hypothetical protein
MTKLEQCKATLREDAARLCAKSKHTGHPFGDCPCTVLAVIEGLETELAEVRRAEMRYVGAVDDLLTDTRRLETELAEARIAQAALAVDLSEWVRQNAFGDYLLDIVHEDGAVEAQWLRTDDVAPLLWAIAEAEAEATNEG